MIDHITTVSAWPVNVSGGFDSSSIVKVVAGESRTRTRHHFKVRLPVRSTVVRASARGAGGRGLIPDHVTPKT